MRELGSSIPGLASFPARFGLNKTADGYVEGRRRMDGAEGLWRIGSRLYDLTNFIGAHPGGSEWLTLTRGTDVTELFETHHLTDRAETLLPKFYVRDAKTPRTVPLTFDETGFYKKFKERAVAALRDVDVHRPAFKSNLVADLLAVTTLTLCIVAASTKSTLVLAIAGPLLAFTAVAGHNYFHMRDSFRMYYFDLSLMSSRDWRITHAMSHHMYTNTIWDFEIYALEPFLEYLPTIRAPISRAASWIYAPLIWSVAVYFQGITRYAGVFLVRQKFEFRDAVPLLIPLLMFIASGNLVEAIKLWIITLGLASFVFQLVGLNAGHHHPDVFHDGDVARKDLDWGLLELDAVRDREIVDDSYVLVLTQFGLHSLHHLLPTVDHSYLPLCLPALEEICREFGVSLGRMTPLELVRGQFRQLRRAEPRKNYRSSDSSSTSTT